MTALVPPNATPLMRGLDAAIAAISDVPTPIERTWNPATCPAGLLPYLAYGLAVTSWSPDWTEAIKRERIRRAIDIKRHAGTVASVESIVAVFGGAIALREWWETSPRGTPHTFELILSLRAVAGAPPSAELIDQVIADIARTKPVRSHFTFSLALQGSASLGMVAAVRPTVYARLSLSAPAA